MSAAKTAFGELRFELPDGWEDRSLLTFLAPPDAGAGDDTALAGLRPLAAQRPLRANLVVTRDPRAGDDDLQVFAGNQLLAARQRLSSLRLVEETELQVAGRRALRFVHTFTDPEGGRPIQQVQLYVEAGKDVVTFTASFPKSAAERYAPLVSDLLSSIAAAG